MLRYMLLLVLMLGLLLPVQAQEATPESTTDSSPDATAVAPQEATPDTVTVATPAPPISSEGTGELDDLATPMFRCYRGPDAFMRHLEQGALNRGRLKLKEAFEHYNCAVKIDPNSYFGYRGRGIAYAAMGSYQLAIADYDVALDLDPNDPVIYFQRGLALHQMEENQAALDSMSQAIRFDPGYALAFNWRGVIQRDLGNLEDAVQDFQIAISLGIPDQRYVPYINLGDLYLNQEKNPAEAVRWYEEAANQVPGQAFIYEKLGDTYLEMGKLQDAERNYEMYIQVANTAKESVRSLIDAAAFRQFVLRYLPAVLILIIAGYFGAVSAWRWWRVRKALKDAADNPDVVLPVLTPETIIPGTPPASVEAEAPPPATPRQNWLALILLPALAGIAYVLRRLASASD